MRSLTLMLALACFAAPAVGAVFGAFVVRLVFGTAFFETWRPWFVADVLGNLAILPVILAIGGHVLAARSSRAKAETPSAAEGLLLTATFLCAGFWIFSTSSPTANTGFRSEMMLAPWLLWCALRFPVGSTTALNVCLVLLVLGSFVSPSGPFATSLAEPAEALLNAQVYAGALLTISLVVGAYSRITQVTNKLLRNMMEQAKALEELTESRTKELWYAAARLTSPSLSQLVANLGFH